MLIVALVLAVIGLVSLVTAVVISNEFVAWVCIGASAVGVILLIVDAVRDRQQRGGDAVAPSVGSEEVPGDPVVGTSSGDEAVDEPEVPDSDAEYPADEPIGFDALGAESEPVDDYPEEIVSEEPEADTVSDDEPLFPESAEEAAIHPVDDEAFAEETAPEKVVDGTRADEAGSR